MIENFNLVLLSGGYHHCTSRWDKPADGLDQCFKLYFPVGGQAHVVIGGEPQRIEAGYVYFISGFQIERQFCEEELDVYWLHFVPDSLQLRYVLSQLAPFRSWPAHRFASWKDVYAELTQLFEEPASQEPRPSPDRPAHLSCRVQSLVLYLLGELLDSPEAEKLLHADPILIRLKPSIEFLNENFLSAPPLEEIASKSHLAPNYFHRLFTKAFGITPLNYITRRRLDMARQLLFGTGLSIKEIAYRVGFSSEFYFSRTFKKHMHVSPSQLRKQGEQW